ncbi:SufD family Fe-S cluster assembly protein [Companilactobacillus insicii]|uniref:SufD family Fe-S cluster assembly protein n=1 Tax=Companilactobacillus insicii TaxID=1732567 RepID=UPI000F7A3F8C|nr:SufD family Fe-S cluster assembly protein [Companilactobacillus insicii]
MKINDEFLEDFELDMNDRGEPHWFINRRIKALKSMNELEFEDSQCFKNKDNFISMDSPLRSKSKKDLVDSKTIDNCTIAQLGQTIVKNDLSDELETKGVILTDILTALRVHPRLVQKTLMDKVISPNEDKMSAYHLSFMNSGVFLYIPKEVKVMEPINIDLIQDNTKSENLNTHVLIVAENDSEVTIHQQLSDVGERDNRTGLFVEVLSRANSKVTYNLNSKSSSKYVYLKSKAYVGRDALVNWNVNLLNEGNTWANLSNNLFGSGSMTNLTLNSHTANDQLEKISANSIKHGKNSSSNFKHQLNSEDDSTIILNGLKY